MPQYESLEPPPPLSPPPPEKSEEEDESEEEGEDSDDEDHDEPPEDLHPLAPAGPARRRARAAITRTIATRTNGMKTGRKNQNAFGFRCVSAAVRPVPLYG